MGAMLKHLLCFLGLICLSFSGAFAQDHSVARSWNEVLIAAIKNDFARPTVQARNLFHTSMAMYDAWAVYEDEASTFFLNHTFRTFYCPFEGIEKPANKREAQEEAISYAAYRLLSHRFEDSPGAYFAFDRFNSLFRSLGYDASFTSTDYSSGSPAALGNYIAEKIIEFGFQDGANEAQQYQNTFYLPVNRALYPFGHGNPDLLDPNRWQPLGLPEFIDQGGISLQEAPPFLSAEWGKVYPFALKKEDLNIYSKKGNKYWVYHDPGPPPLLNLQAGTVDQEYLWTFSLVPVWSSHLKNKDDYLIDISPASIGNIQSFPQSLEEMKTFYQNPEGGAMGKGYAINPKTGAPYEPQMVPRGDYTRVLAEFWADGPDSETPPGHWFTILNAVNDHPLHEKKIGGEGDLLDNLEWDVKAYLALGGALHDAAVSAWGIKGYYDYIRPISAIRAMAERGQSSDPSLPSYHPAGIPLVEGYIELVKSGDPLSSQNPENLNEIKIYSWSRFRSSFGSEADDANVGWILAKDWWPYQRPTFVTPPFAGYVSGHSTFSRAAAEVLTLLSGDEFFPGGLSEFKIYKNRYLAFEQGPGMDLTLQWAKYKDAADQCSLSRIWGGIHPPADDIPGRIIGQKIGVDAFHFALNYFNGLVPPEPAPEWNYSMELYPNPLLRSSPLKLKIQPALQDGSIRVVNMMGQLILEKAIINNVEEVIELHMPTASAGMYMVILESQKRKYTAKFIIP